MKIDELYPIGTLVTLKGGNGEKYLTVGFLPTNQNGETRDYSAIRYPMGVYDSRLYFFFDHIDIDSVVHLGYSDNEFDALKMLIATFDDKDKIN